MGCYQRAISQRNPQQARLCRAHELALDARGLIAVLTIRASIISCSCSMSSMMRSTSIPSPSSSTKRELVKRCRIVFCK